MWYYAPRALRAVGVSEQTPDLVDLIADVRTIQVAFCKSRKCVGSITAKAVEKKVKPNVDRCPSCGDYLFFKTITRPRKGSASHEQENQHHR